MTSLTLFVSWNVRTVPLDCNWSFGCEQQVVRKNPAKKRLLVQRPLIKGLQLPCFPPCCYTAHEWDTGLLWTDVTVMCVCEKVESKREKWVPVSEILQISLIQTRLREKDYMLSAARLAIVTSVVFTVHCPGLNKDAPWAPFIHWPI